MKILLLGGTGAIGNYLVDILSEYNHDVCVTSRSKRENSEHVTYVQGNAYDDIFLESLCKDHWDAIVDFMSYKTGAFNKRVKLLLNSTDQYFYISSARVYSDVERPIRETSPRLLDVIGDKEYLSTDEYALTKARQENILRETGKNNYTIIRPYITYGDYRLQLGVMEKEEWLYRALHGRTIVFSKEIAERTTTITNGYDVSYGIFKLIGNPKAFGESFHITSKTHLTWSEIYDIYRAVILEKTGKDIKCNMVDTGTFIKCRRLDFKYQVLYDRLYDRIFDTTKESLMASAESFVAPKEGLTRCMANFLIKPKYKDINWQLEAYKDRLTHEWTPYSEIGNLKLYIKYLIVRLGLIKTEFNKIS